MTTTAKTTSKPAAKKPAAKKPATPKLKGAAAKFAWIQQQAAFSVEKTGHHEKFGYDFFQEHGILGIINPLLKEINAAIIPDFTDLAYDGNTVSGTLNITLIDPETPREDADFGISARFPGYAIDSQDKGPYKLETQAFKYALQKFFAIPTEAVPDVDTDESTPVAKRVKAATQKIDTRKAAALRATAAQAVEDKKLDQKTVTAYLTAEFGKNRVTELTQAEGDTFEAWLLKKIGG